MLAAYGVLRILKPKAARVAIRIDIIRASSSKVPPDHLVLLNDALTINSWILPPAAEKN